PLLEQSTLEDYESPHRADAVGAVEAATVAKSNAEAKARLAVIGSNEAKARADHERKAAQAAYLAAEQQKAALEQTLAAKQTELSAKQDELAQLTYGRRQWLDYMTAKHAYDVWLAAKIAREQARQRRLAREQ